LLLPELINDEEKKTRKRMVLVPMQLPRMMMMDDLMEVMMMKAMEKEKEKENDKKKGKGKGKG
jgi:hypothetical protein